MKLTAAEIDQALQALPGWTRQGDAVVRQFTFSSFRDAIAFVTRLAFEAEAADHHPDLAINYKRVTVTWSTHDAGGVTRKDVDGVKATNGVAQLFLAGKTA
jgi:4a-hydroxytetrahydrobiopterin dehydratase